MTEQEVIVSSFMMMGLIVITVKVMVIYFVGKFLYHLYKMVVNKGE